MVILAHRLLSIANPVANPQLVAPIANPILDIFGPVAKYTTTPALDYFVGVCDR